jgi:hypothetical protein
MAAWTADWLGIKSRAELARALPRDATHHG